MNLIVPFTKDVKFESSLGDIVSISLEHDYNLNNNIILGNFVVSGTYKTHELSANALDFSYTLPFELSLSSEVEDESLEFAIDNFTYEVKAGDVLKVDIDYLVKAKELVREESILEEPIIFEEDLSSEIESIFENEENEITLKDLVNNYDTEEVIKEEVKIIKVDNIEIDKNEEEDRETFEKETILNFASENKESFVTYKIHTLKEGETVETLAKFYNKSENDIIEYNLGVAFNSGDKILISQEDE